MPQRTSDLQEMFLTTGQAAAALNVNRLTIQRWVNAGRLNGQRVGNVTLIPRDEVESLVRRTEKRASE